MYISCRLLIVKWTYSANNGCSNERKTRVVQQKQNIYCGLIGIFMQKLDFNYKWAPHILLYVDAVRKITEQSLQKLWFN